MEALLYFKRKFEELKHKVKLYKESQKIINYSTIYSNVVELINNNNNYNDNNDDELDQILDINNEQLNTNINSYHFEICDILLNIASCGHTISGESSNDYRDYLKLI